jgi:dGTPase
VKHNGPLLARERGDELPYAIRAFQSAQDLELDRFAGLEAQAAAIADDIAYDCHDIEDGLRAGLIDLAELEEQPLTAPILRPIHAAYPGLERARVVHELIRRMITIMIVDVLAETGRRLAESGVKSADAVRGAGRTLVAFSPALAREEAGLKRFLTAHVYRHDAVMRPVRLAEALVADLFEAFFDAPERMPEDWGEGLQGADAVRRARRVADYIAGMTDRYAVAEHQRLFDDTPDLG